MDALTDSPPFDSMVEIARIISPSEALTLRAMFEAADIVCHVGGWWHHSAQLCGLGLGGFRLSVSRIHHEPASVLIREYLAQPVGAAPFYAQRRRVVRLLGILAITIVVPSMVTMRAGDNLAPWWAYIVAPMTLLGTPVPAQGSGDYYLAAKPVA